MFQSTLFSSGSNGRRVHGFLPTAREGYIFTGVCHSVHNRPYGKSVTYGAVGMHPTGMLSFFPKVLQNDASPTRLVLCIWALDW